MVFHKIFLLFLLYLYFCAFGAAIARPGQNMFNSNDSVLVGVELPDHQGFNSVASPANTGCDLSQTERTSAKLSEAAVPEEKDDDDADGYVVGSEAAHKGSLKLHLKHRSTTQRAQTGKKESVTEFTSRDLTRIHTLHKRIRDKKNQNMLARLTAEKQPLPVLKQFSASAEPESITADSTGSLVATLESGVTLGSGEYFMDVFVGTPPKHFSLILDTGSDLNWIQCLPCHDCFEQNGPFYNPQESSSFQNITCHDPRCQLVSSPDPPQPCKAENQSCPYFYWYGDFSNTTGDFAVETFTVNLTTPAGKSEFQKVENVMFGCGHWNRGLFHGAAGLLGLGRGPLSFSSQLRSLYGHTFSYCLVDRNSDMSVSSKLIFGEDKSLMSHPNLNFTSLVAGKENPVDTFYYIQIKSIMVGGQVLQIPEETWQLSSEGAGGTIIDSGTTLSYFADPAYQLIKEAFAEKVKYPVVKDLPVLDLCYNVSGVEKSELPEFAILFGDGAVWNFPVENYFIRLDPEEIVCLAILGMPSSLSILGNYQQQNFHILYDTKKSRLGFAPMKCSDMSEEGKSRGFVGGDDQQQQQQYGTFQGVPSYPQPQTVIGIPQPVPPPGVGSPYPSAPPYYAHGYQAVPDWKIINESGECEGDQLAKEIGTSTVYNEGNKVGFQTLRIPMEKVEHITIQNPGIKSITIGLGEVMEEEPSKLPSLFDIAILFGPQLLSFIPASILPVHFCWFSVYAVAEVRPVRERHLPCCGIGIGWLFFISGFFLAAIPWYVGAIILLCVRSVDYREKPGLIACTVANLFVAEMVTFRFHQYQVVGRALPTESDDHPKIYRMKLWATNDVRAKSKFWYFLRKLKKVKKSNGQVLAINEIFEKNPTKIKNYGIWLRYQSRTGYHNMYKEYRDTTLNGAVEDMYNEMASRHRVRFPCIQIIKTATIPANLCKRESTKQFHNAKIKFPLVFRKVRPPSRKLKTTYKASKPNLFM
ncbi:uncharacterized protein LOC122651144 [Telopea speciosissima]|uniref:uncharacterized protein LOC122651144 n=1 Tax=Telopea speciosissima TaxID=54955 RepID=UPI001CC80E70|nr:uncharacterized protein LOC122651144 [Telopea speciosissima]